MKEFIDARLPTDKMDRLRLPTYDLLSIVRLMYHYRFVNKTAHTRHNYVPSKSMFELPGRLGGLNLLSSLERPL